MHPLRFYKQFQYCIKDVNLSYLLEFSSTNKI